MTFADNYTSTSTMFKQFYSMCLIGFIVKTLVARRRRGGLLWALGSPVGSSSCMKGGRVTVLLGDNISTSLCVPAAGLVAGGTTGTLAPSCPGDN